MPDGSASQTSLFVPGTNCEEVARARRVSMIVDGQDYFRAFARAAERAEREIIILAWDFDSRTPLDFDGDGKPEVTLGEFLDGLARRNRKLRIHILDWDYPMVFGTGREFPLTFGITWHPHRRIDFRYDDTHPLIGSHHQKIVVIDDRIAFCGGLDLTSKRWDTHEHAPDDPRRTWDGKPYPPFHDTMIAVDGEAARALGRIARRRWFLATSEEIREVRDAKGDPWPRQLPVHIEDVDVAVAVTSPPQDHHPALRHVEQLYLDMIARARKYIYIENQYFTSQRIGEALEARLVEPDGPEIIVLTRLLSHGWLEEMTMTNLRTRLVNRLREADVHGKLRVYYPHRGGLCEGTCIDLHSKLMIVDDEWLRIGSSNLSNRSMAVDTECDVVVEARGDERVRKAIRAFLHRLIAEHSLATEEEVARMGGKHASLRELIDAGPGPQDRCIRKLEVEALPEAALSLASIGDMEKPISLDGLVQNLTPPGDPVPARRGRLIAGASLIAVVTLAFLWRYTPLADIVTPQTAIEFAQALSDHWWAPLVVVAAYTPASVVLLPRWIITLAAVLAFGPWAGFVYAQLGVILAAVAGYLLGRIIHRDTVQRIAGHGVLKLSRLLQRRGIIAVTLVRLVPIAPFIVVNAVMGAMRIRLRHFVLGTVFGMLPGMLATTVLGDQIAALLANPLKFNVWMLVGALALVALAGTSARHLARRRKA